MAGTIALHQQRMGALARGNEVRSARRVLKAELKAGTVDPARLIKDVPDAIAGVRVYKFLMWLPWVGSTRARNYIRAADIRDVEIGRLASTERARLAETLPRRTA